MVASQLKKLGQKQDGVKQDLCLFGQINFRGKMKKFGIKTDDRRRHMYIIGKTGMGKSTLMENMILQDIYNGHGVGLVDPHGDFAENIIDFIPENRIDDVIYFNPADKAHPVGFNILEVVNEDQKHLVVGGLMATFKKIWPDVWSSRMEYILANTLTSLVEVPGSTLMGINRMYADKTYRKSIISQMVDPMVKRFWHDEYDKWEPRYAKEAVAPVQNKVGQFLSTSIIRNMVAQEKSGFNIREAMDSKKIVVVNLSKGRLGEDNSSLLGGMIITKIQLAAMERVDQLESERKDFFLYVDEFQNFATPSFASILSEARKYRLGLIMAHQYVAQLDEVVADAVFGNVGTLVSFRVGSADADSLVKEFTPQFVEEDLVNLGKFNIILKLMIDGVASAPFSSGTLPPIGSPTGSFQKVVDRSREQYAGARADIEAVVNQWSEDVGKGGKKEDPKKGRDGYTKKSFDPKRELQSRNKRQGTKSPSFDFNQLRKDSVRSVLPQKNTPSISFTSLPKKHTDSGPKPKQTVGSNHPVERTQHTFGTHKENRKQRTEPQKNNTQKQTSTVSLQNLAKKPQNNRPAKNEGGDTQQKRSGGKRRRRRGKPSHQKNNSPSALQ
ncbi:MAG: hypothetical protein CL685_02375 [Candidatus Magasanikbacteria bacterium]|nr:hypothetical protein [Candidatus Magasanikbacteria bacterium]|tara:strand:- start:1952 stop:3784 length:1833 start_codon:yes stop_codon:yes gene_type:complete